MLQYKHLSYHAFVYRPIAHIQISAAKVLLFSDIHNSCPTFCIFLEIESRCLSAKIYAPIEMNTAGMKRGPQKMLNDKC